MLFNQPGCHIHNERGKKTSHHGGEERSDDHGEGEEGRVQPVGRQNDHINRSCRSTMFSQKKFSESSFAGGPKRGQSKITQQQKWIPPNLSVSPYCSP